MDSTSPFTPKKSRIKMITSGEINIISRALLFDDSNSPSHLPFNKNLEFSPLSQQVLLPCENELIKSEQITPVKMEHSDLNKINKILVSPSIKNRPNRFNIDEETKIIIKPSPRKRNGSNNSTPSKKIKLNGSENCKPITHYFPPTQKNVLPVINKIDHYFNSATEERLNEEKIKPNPVKSECSTNSLDFSKQDIANKIKLPTKTTIDPNIQNKKKKKSNITDVKSQFSKEQVTKQLNFSLSVTPTKNGIINNANFTPTKSPKIIELLENRVTISGGDTYSRFIKSLVMKPEIFFLCGGNIIDIVDDCTDDELKIYGRLIARKHGWIRLDEPDGLKKYREANLCHDFDSVLKSLATKQLINTDVISCELDSLLNILKSHELKKLQKTFNINSSSSKSQNKPEMIKSFINLVKNQRTFCGNSTTNLKECIKKIVGYCLKLSDSSRDDVMSCLISESYPYFSGDEKDRFRDCFTKFSLVEKNQLKFPTFHVARSSIFITKDSFEMYKNALNLRYEVQLSLEQKDHNNAITVLLIVFEKLKSAVHDESITNSFFELPTYLRKYSALSVYTHILFKNVSILKKSSTNKDLAKDVLEFLIQHKKFSISKIPDLHIELAKVFESQYKQLNLAAKVILDGLKDKTVNELGRQMLSNRAMIYVNRKIRKLDSDLKEELLRFTSTTEKQLPSTTINGKIISTTEKISSGRKQVYSKKTENGDILYMSVEDLALSYYKSLGYLNGIHDEGQLIKSMFLLCCWDIIYGSYPPHTLFIRQYQDCPLDWRSRHFYNIREQRIKDRIAELKLMTADQICDILKTGCDKYYETQSVVNWKFINVDNLPICKTVLECVGIKVFLAIGNQILKDGRVYLYGMPDLIIWDVVNHKCMFVEVKGPKDKLSEKQTSWLYKLIEFGANVEVCHVVGTGGKNEDNYQNSD